MKIGGWPSKPTQASRQSQRGNWHWIFLVFFLREQPFKLCVCVCAHVRMCVCVCVRVGVSVGVLVEIGSWTPKMGFGFSFWFSLLKLTCKRAPPPKRSIPSSQATGTQRLDRPAPGSQSPSPQCPPAEAPPGSGLSLKHFPESRAKSWHRSLPKTEKGKGSDIRTWPLSGRAPTLPELSSQATCQVDEGDGHLAGKKHIGRVRKQTSTRTLGSQLPGENAANICKS